MLTQIIENRGLSWAWVATITLALSACGGESENSASVSASSVPATSPSNSSATSSSVSSLTNNPPVIIGLPMTTATVGSGYSFTPSATDADGNPLSFSATGVPAWAMFDVATHRLSGTPTAAGSYGPITISVTDGNATTSLSAFTIVVTAAMTGNAAPVISGSPATSVPAGNAYAFSASATDANGDALTFTISNKPVWAAFNTVTGTLTGTPTAAQRGMTSGIVISVSDGKGGTASLAGFSITVANRTPTITGTPTTAVAAGNPYSFTPSSADADGDARTYSIINKPTWAAFNTTTGALTGTPSAAQQGSFAGIVISVSDGKGDSASLPTFSINVTNTANTAPILSGTPATTGQVGTAYTFSPTASDANGDTLAFSISNKPAWATFNTLTGALTGAPTATGSFSSITISVSDGTTTTSLPTFTISVSVGTTGSATLSWTAPMLNTDGTPLTDLAGYTIYYGTSSSNLGSSISITSASTTNHTISGLATGATYYFAIASINSAGIASDLSSVASKTI